MTQGAERPECAPVLNVARASFDSPSEELYFVTDEVFSRTELGIVLAPTNDDTYLHNPTYFSEVDVSGSLNLLSHENIRRPRLYGYFLQTLPVSSERIVLSERPMNWAGNLQAVYSVPAALTLEEIASVLTDHNSSQRTTIVREQHYEPWIISDDATSQMIAIDTGDSRQFFRRWTARIVDATEDPSICTVEFWPEARTAFDLVPAGSLRELALLLDDIIGQNSGGSMNVVGRVRNNAARTWVNVLYRPWAVGEPYNSAEEVEAGLAEWSNWAPSYQQQYLLYKSLRPEALIALRRYYAARFPEEDSTLLAAEMLDIAIGSNFVFSKMN